MNNNTFNWICPYCNKQTTIVRDSNESVEIHFYDSPSKEGLIGLKTRIIVCPNPECKEYVIIATLYKANAVSFQNPSAIRDSDALYTWNLRPQSHAMPLPEYIPQQIRDDYNESCLILSLSPKAAATLARRCLQGMIHDFWKIQKRNLFDEISELKDKIDHSTWEAIDAIRMLGNIAHTWKKTSIQLLILMKMRLLF
jgi:hypothetical protein